MKRFFLKYIMCIILSSAFLFSSGQNAITQSNTVFWGNADAFLNRQAEFMFKLIEYTLETHLPELGQPLARKLALYNLDALLHDTRYDQSKALQQFMARRIKSTIDDLSRPTGEGMKIYKLYNHGFVVRTKTVTIAFDLYRGKSLIPDSLMQAIVDKCDILFISHLHGDHADMPVAEMFIKADKPVWAPNNVWGDNTKIKHIRSEKLIKDDVLIRGEKLSVKVLPGHQDQLINNIYEVITPEGYSVVHTGDQYSKEDMEWISKIKNQIERLDVLLVNCWTLNFAEFIDCFDPELVITGHENEMGHTIDHREPYWLSFHKLRQISKPYVLMTWGEHYRYFPLVHDKKY